MQKILREPLLHFAVLGFALFALYGWLNEGLPGAENEIVVSRGQTRSLQAQFERVWQRQPTPEELQGLVDNWVREEIFYREGIVMGLDRDDPVVRRRIAQKLEFILDGAALQAPTEAELQEWLDAHADRYAIEARYSLRQLYFDPARRGELLEQTIEAARDAAAKGKSPLADATMLPPALSGSASEIARIFGGDFEKALRTLPVGGWQGPVHSGFGVHLVELQSRKAARTVRLHEVREAVERDLLHARSEVAEAAFYARIRANYDVRIEDADAAATEPAG
jgi:parvulin-like peptidyl-prolyl isomerase